MQEDCWKSEDGISYIVRSRSEWATVGTVSEKEEKKIEDKRPIINPK